VPAVKGTADEGLDFGQDEDGEPIIPIKKAAKKRVFPPELVLLDPKPRTYSNTSKVNDQPCGGAEKSNVHYIVSPGSKNHI
jgi:hypothetical protein